MIRWATRLVKEECGLCGSDDACQGSANLEFATRVAGYKVLHATRDVGDDKPYACDTVTGRTSSTRRDQLRGG